MRRVILVINTPDHIRVIIRDQGTGEMEDYVIHKDKAKNLELSLKMLEASLRNNGVDTLILYRAMRRVLHNADKRKGMRRA